MDEKIIGVLKARSEKEHYQKLARIDNPELHRFIAKYVELCDPDKIFISDNSPKDIGYIREMAVISGEESELALKGHTIHFDGYFDQARDKEHTCILISNEFSLDPLIRVRDRSSGLEEINEILSGIMKGHTLYVCFFSLGPRNSNFSIPCVQLTDSSYVAHSEILLYRAGYEDFVRQGSSARFFKFVHSQGELDDRKASRNLDKRRVYIDLQDDIVYSTNSQYAGNTLGLKKLAMRLAIRRGSREGWLTEHMLIMGIHGPKKRVTYFLGAFPSLGGKTSTAMLDSETMVGDDIAYLRKRDGHVRAANVEKGMFGIIQGVNSRDNPFLWRAFHKSSEIIFSNVLVTEKKGIHWLGKDGGVPNKGYNYSGEWWAGKKDDNGKEIPCSHPNARFTVALRAFENLDPKLDDPEGVKVGGIVYGGRDSDTWVPVEESFDWIHGTITKGASLESETTAATLGERGVREFNPMSNLDFLSIPLGKYIQNHLDFNKNLKDTPRIFGVNYFLKDEDDKYVNVKADKKVWYQWMELRVHNEIDAIDTPTGRIPKYDDLKGLFKDALNKEYAKEDYIKQFTVRVKENLAKIDRIKNIYETKVSDPPRVVFDVLEDQRQRLLSAKEKYGDYISPDKL